MRVPIRKAGQYTNLKLDPTMTKSKFAELQAELKKLKEIVHPQAAEEVKRLAAMGDFSENAAYQMAKGKLRGLNQRIIDLEKMIAEAKIIQPDDNKDSIQLGSVVTVEINGNTKVYKILGSVETDPAQGIISYNSPLGQILLGKKIGEIIQMPIAERKIEYKIIAIN